MEALETRLPRRTRHLRYPVVVLSGQVGDGLARGFVAAYEDSCARRKIRHYAAGDENDYDTLIRISGAVSRRETIPHAPSRA